VGIDAAHPSQRAGLGNRHADDFSATAFARTQLSSAIRSVTRATAWHHTIARVARRLLQSRFVMLSNNVWTTAARWWLWRSIHTFLAASPF
jgi:hypothetical protein